jgi:hypothetical protein
LRNLQLFIGKQKESNEREREKKKKRKEISEIVGRGMKLRVIEITPTQSGSRGKNHFPDKWEEKLHALL